MATWDDVARVCLALPGTTEVDLARAAGSGGCGTSCSSGSGRCGRGTWPSWAPSPPTGPVLGARVPDEGAKAALIAEEPDVYFTTSHFDGYPAVLCRLDAARTAQR